MNRLIRSGAIATLFVLIVLVTQAQAGRLQAASTSNPASDAVVLPPCNESNLITAFNAVQASGGGTLTFACGGPTTILVLHPLTVTQNTVIRGGDIITLDGALNNRLIYVPSTSTSLTLDRIMLYNAFNFNGSGGAIWSAGSLTLTNVTVKNSQTSLSYCGGALIVAGNTFITHTTFSSNVAGLGGGAICVRSQPGTKVQVTNSSFFDNQAVDTTNGYGGAIYVEYGTANVLDSLFLGNSAHFGGAVSALYDNATLTLQGSPTSSPYSSAMQLNANHSTEDGGAIYNWLGTMKIDNTVISANRTPTGTLLAGYGGAIYDGGVMTLTNSIVSTNQGRFGGGMFVGNSNAARAVIDRVSFLNNVSGVYGGGLYANIVTTTVTVSNSAFSSNMALSAGGGLARVNAGLRVVNSSFTYNTAAGGGGMWIGALPGPTDGPYVRVQNVTVSDNTATSNQGGGILNNGRAELYSMTIVTNTQGVYSYNGANTRFRDTVLQNPGYLNCDNDGTGSVSDDLHNFSTDNSCVLPNSQTGIGLDPKLGPLHNDGLNTTYYHMPLAGSPLIDYGVNCLAYDQRNVARIGACDTGAVEYIPPVYLPLIVK